jgi:PAS domain S-box-containing protein
MLALGISGILPSVIGQGLGSQTLIEIFILAAGLGYNGIFWLLCRRPNQSLRYYELLGGVQILSDILLISYLLFSHGGIESRTIVAFAIPILAAGALFGQKMNYVASGICASLYVLILLLDWSRIVPSPGAEFPKWHEDPTFYMTSILFYPVTLFVISLMSDFIQRLLDKERRRAEIKTTALEQAQAIAHLGSWEVNVATGIITMSDELFRIYGIEKRDDKTNSKAILEATHPDDRDKLEAANRAIFKNHEPFELEQRILRPDGAERVLRAMGRARLNDDGQPEAIVGVTLDITDIKSAEQALREQNAEMEKFNQIMVGRELKMAELKERLAKLERVGK